MDSIFSAMEVNSINKSFLQDSKLYYLDFVKKKGIEHLNNSFFKEGRVVSQNFTTQFDRLKIAKLKE